jgi:hypothetical protein
VPFLVLALVPIILLLIVLLIPVGIVQRYRVGTRRQPVRGWLASLNVWAFAASALLFLLSAAVTDLWVPRAFLYTLAGLALGSLLGLLGLWLTRWEPTGESLHYTANRWLVLAITVAVGARILYGFWRAWESWSSGIEGGAWVVATGAAESLGAGAVVIGYYLVYWWGLRRRFRRHAELRAPVRSSW